MSARLMSGPYPNHNQHSAYIQGSPVSSYRCAKSMSVKPQQMPDHSMSKSNSFFALASPAHQLRPLRSSEDGIPEITLHMLSEDRFMSVPMNETHMHSQRSVGTPPGDSSVSELNSSSDGDVPSARGAKKMSASHASTDVEAGDFSEYSSSDSEHYSLRSSKSINTASTVASGTDPGTSDSDSPSSDSDGINQVLAKKLLHGTVKRAQRVLDQLIVERVDYVDPSLLNSLQQYIETAEAMQQGAARKDHVLAMIEHVEPLLRSANTCSSKPCTHIPEANLLMPWGMHFRNEEAKRCLSPRDGSGPTETQSVFPLQVAEGREDDRQYVDLADPHTKELLESLAHEDAERSDGLSEEVSSRLSDTQSMSASEKDRWIEQTCESLHADAAAIAEDGPRCPWCGQCFISLSEEEVDAHLDTCDVEAEDEQKLVMQEEMPHMCSHDGAITTAHAADLLATTKRHTAEIRDLEREIQGVAEDIAAIKL